MIIMMMVMMMFKNVTVKRMMHACGDGVNDTLRVIVLLIFEGIFGLEFCPTSYLKRLIFFR